MGAARYYQAVYQWDWLHPLYGAVAAAIIAAIIIGLVSIRAKQREDTIIGAVWAIGMADGNWKVAIRCKTSILPYLLPLHLPAAGTVGFQNYSLNR